MSDELLNSSLQIDSHHQFATDHIQDEAIQGQSLCIADNHRRICSSVQHP